MSASLIVSDGRDQLHRRPPALCGDYFQPNEMSFEQLLAQAAEYAHLMRFYQLDLQAEGDWYAYFSADETILMATILAVDTGKMLNQFELRLERQPVYALWFAPDIARPLRASYLDQLDSPLLVVRALHVWLESMHALQGHAGKEVRMLLEGLLNGMEREVKELLDATPTDLIGPVRQLFPSRFSHLEASGERPLQPVSANLIRHNFHTLTQLVRMLQNGIRHLLPASLLSGDHDPGASLLIAFIELFQQVLQRLNRFGDQRIDFYYRRVLGMQPQPQQPDSAFLVIRPTAAARQIQIEAGAEFIGGVDELQHDIVYVTERAATLNDAHVAALHTLYFERWPTLGTVGCNHHRFDMLQLDSDEREHEKLPAMPLMGAPKPGEPLQSGCAAGFGFILASKVLLMREGERVVRVQFQYHLPDNTERESLEDSLERVREEVRNDPQRSGHEVDTIRIVDVFVRLFRSMFRISLTTPDGWYVVDEYRPEYSGLNFAMPEDCLAIEFVLPASAPPVVPYQAALHGGDYDSVLPLLRFEMTQNEYRYPYDILTQCILQDIAISVDVRAVRQLLLHNQIGQLSALAPFMPFGPLPAVGSYLVVGCEEILYKQLRDLSLDIEWTGLPTGVGGMVGYYRGYAEPLRCDAVLASISALADGKWLVAGRPVPVFRYELNPDGSKSKLTDSDMHISFRPAVRYHKPASIVPAANGAAFDYTSASTDGLFKLMLDSPDGALKHQEYPALLSGVLTHNAQQKKKFLMRPLPNPPYTPQISRIALNYRARASITFESGRAGVTQAETDSFIHLHPLGWQTMLLSDSRIIRQIPWYESPGQLFIGVEGEQLRGTLSLYFYLRDDSLPMTGIKATGLAWHYLSDNRWRPLAATRILEDSTQGFMVSGIVLLQLPEDIDTGNTIMPSGQFWLSVSAEEGMERFCSLYSVYAQAIKVTWSAAGGAKPQAVMPAMRITRSRQNIPGIDSIFQIRRSFDGKAAETALQFRVRASERLRHKNRALTAADFEQLILERYPQVYKVKCFPNLQREEAPEHWVRPGHILIVAIPYLNRGGHANQKPTLSGHLLGEIGHYVRQYASPDVVIQVENPVYEEVQVRCSVKLRSQVNGGRLSEQINQALCDYLSPWRAAGINQHFGWTLRQHEVVAFLLDLDYVEAVSAVSLLQIVPLDQRSKRLFRLRDNAVQTDPRQKKDLQPRYPWSIVVPMNQHWIVLCDQLDDTGGKVIGINELKIGSTFIIPSKDQP